MFLLPPTFTYAQPTVLTIGFLYGGGGTLPAGYENADFKLAFVQTQSGTPSQATVGLSVTLKANNMWKAAPAARAALGASFVDFLQQIEAQFELAGTIIPGGTFRIGQQLADAIPAPPLETLFYRYSLSPGLAPKTTPCIDLRPGMQLRVETQTSQFLAPSSPLNGYVSSGRFNFVLNSMPSASGARLVTFDPFLGTIRAPSVGGAAQPVIAGGLVDLEPVSGARTYWRLFYPQTVASPAQPGDLSVGGNVTLLGAPTLAQLNAATTAYPNLQSTGTPPNVYAIFLGRALAIPEIPIWITARGLTTFQYVPVGTTLAHVIERFTLVPLSTQSPGVAVTRTTSANSSGASAGFTFFTQNLSAMPPAMFDVPLIAGDGVTLTNV